MRFVDTNILLYFVSLSPADAAKRARAEGLLRARDLALSAQVLQEFYTQATRPTRPDRLADAEARDLVISWTRYPVQPVTTSIIFAALDIKSRHGFSYWDSAIIAAATALGCAELLTEDLQHGRIVEGVHIINPFL